MIDVITHRLFYGVSMLLVLVSGCRNGNSSQPVTSDDLGQKPAQQVAGETAADLPPVVSKPAPPVVAAVKKAVPDPMIGRVVETMGAGGYVYMLVATDAGEHWAAARTFPVDVGDEVELKGLAAMPRFSSPTLKRTFDVIQFVGAARVIGGGDGAAGKAPAVPALASELPAGHPAIGDVVAPVAKIIAQAPAIAADANVVSVADLYAKKADLVGKLVQIRGKVVKANRSILGSNWLHIQDGSGAAPENDITVTSKAGYAEPGTTVIIVGMLALDRDFGSGYKYDVIVENATVIPAGE